MKFIKTLRNVVLIFLLQSVSAHADDLLCVYKQALDCDPTFKAAYADLLTSKANVKINAADFGPQVDFAAEALRKRFVVDGIEIINGPPELDSQPYFDKNTHYVLTVTQPVFNFATFTRYQNAEASARAVQAMYCAANQDLIYRVGRAYVTILQAKNLLRYTRLVKRKIGQELEDVKKQIQNKTATAITLADTVSRYDEAIANEINARNDLNNAIEDLRIIIGCVPPTLMGLGPHFPLVIPQPACVEVWVDTANRQNYELLATRYNAIAAKENIKTQAAGHLPIVNIMGAYDYQYDSNINNEGERLRIRQAYGGVNTVFPIFHAGKTLAETDQARSIYQQACAVQEMKRREVVSNTRKSFANIQYKIQKLRASQQSIIALQKTALETSKMYQSKTKTLLDLLTAQTFLLNTQTNNLNDRYNYILELLRLKQAIGTLSCDDLVEINCWLVKEETLLCDDRF